MRSTSVLEVYHISVCYLTKHQTCKLNWSENIYKTPKIHLKIETESLLCAAQDHARRTNYIKVRINKTQQNSKCRLYGDRDETFKHMKSECSKLAQNECKNRHD